jgi:hypothetical protein
MLQEFDLVMGILLLVHFVLKKKFSVEMVIPCQISTPVDMATLIALKFYEPTKSDEKYKYSLFPSFAN